MSKPPKFPPYKLAPLDILIPYANNARTHSDAQVAKIAASIVEFGFTNPVLTDGANGIVAGHGRVLAAKKLGLTQVPVIDLTHLSAAQRKAYVIADNKLAPVFQPQRFRVDVEHDGNVVMRHAVARHSLNHAALVVRGRVRHAAALGVNGWPVASSVAVWPVNACQRSTATST